MIFYLRSTIVLAFLLLLLIPHNAVGQTCDRLNSLKQFIFKAPNFFHNQSTKYFYDDQNRLIKHAHDFAYSDFEYTHNKKIEKYYYNDLSVPIEIRIHHFDEKGQVYFIETTESSTTQPRRDSTYYDDAGNITRHASYLLRDGVYLPYTISNRSYNSSQQFTKNFTEIYDGNGVKRRDINFSYVYNDKNQLTRFISFFENYPTNEGNIDTIDYSYLSNGLLEKETIISYYDDIRQFDRLIYYSYDGDYELAREYLYFDEDLLFETRNTWKHKSDNPLFDYDTIRYYTEFGGEMKLYHETSFKELELPDNSRYLIQKADRSFSIATGVIDGVEIARNYHTILRADSPDPNALSRPTIYPNPSPASSQLKIACTSGTYGKAYIYNAMGQLIATHKIDKIQHTIPSPQVPGLYYVQLEGIESTPTSVVSIVVK